MRIDITPLFPLRDETTLFSVVRTESISDVSPAGVWLSGGLTSATRETESEFLLVWTVMKLTKVSKRLDSRSPTR
ncbi:MAG: hypothetical protein ACKOE0_05955, partial [Actinomycetes bacterium]